MIVSWMGVDMAWPDEKGAMDAAYDHTVETGHNRFTLAYGPIMGCAYEGCEFSWTRGKVNE